MYLRSNTVLKHVIKVSLTICGTLFSFLSIVLMFASWSELGIMTTLGKVIVFFSIAISSILVGLFYVCILQQKRVILQSGSNKIVVQYGDIIQFGFSRKGKMPRIVVIPVNTAFDTIVDGNPSDVDYPLVSPHSIHGQWILRLEKEGYSRDELNANIQSQLQKYTAQNQMNPIAKERGNIYCYEKGTIALIKWNETVTFLLLAIAEFDEKNNAHSSQIDIMNCIDKLLEFINERGQGHEVYLPLMGTGFSRAGLSPNDSLLMIKTKLLLNNQSIRGTVNIVVHENNRFQVSLDD